MLYHDSPFQIIDNQLENYTFVLQYQFSDLKVNEERMEVTLSFNNVPERLVVPLNAISIFADPSVNFALQFQPLGDVIEDEDLILQEMEDDDDGVDYERVHWKRTWMQN